MSHWSQSDFMCSKSTIETLKGLKSHIKKTDTRTISIDVVLVLSFVNSTGIFRTYLPVSVNFPQVTVSYDDHLYCLFTSTSYVIAL